MWTEHTEHRRRTVDRLEQLVADAERRIDEHVDLMSRIGDRRAFELAAALLREYSSIVEVLRTRLAMEQRYRDTLGSGRWLCRASLPFERIEPVIIAGFVRAASERPGG